MQTQIKKIIIGAAALVFVISGVSLADDRGGRHHKPQKKAYGHYKVKKQPPGWSNKHFKPNRHNSKRYVYKEVRGHRYYDDHHRRPVPREDVIYKVALKDPKVVFKIIVKDHR